MSVIYDQVNPALCAGDEMRSPSRSKNHLCACSASRFIMVVFGARVVVKCFESVVLRGADVELRRGFAVQTLFYSLWRLD